MVSGKGNVLDQYRCSDIYNALETGNDSLALTKADALLKKGPLPLASALRSIALVRLGRIDDARNEIEVLLRGNIDAGVLAPLSFVMPLIGMEQKLADLYIFASQAQPKNQELAEDAFLTLVKGGMLQRAQQFLLKQYRTSKDKKDFWRYVQVAVLQSQQLKPPGSTLALQVALRLLNENPVDESTFTEETLSLYLRFHLLLGKAHLGQALAMMQEPVPKRLAENSLGIQFLLREAWEAHGDLGSVADDCRARIVAGDRNWAVIYLYIRMLVALATQASEALHDADLAVLVDAAEKDKWADRGSFLGVLEMYRQANAAKLSTAYLAKRGAVFGKLLAKYYVQFSTKATCFEDLYPYLCELSDEDRTAFLAAALQKKPPLTSEDGIVRCVNAEKIKYLLEPHGKQVAAGRLLNEYVTSLRFARLPDTEMQTGDDLALLASYMSLTAADVPTHLCAAAIASYGVAESPRGYRLRMLFIRLLQELGAMKLAFAQYTVLGLKAVQFDTASHIGLERNAAFGGALGPVMENEWSDHMAKFYGQSDSELPEVIGQAFSNNKFSQIASLCEFGHRLETSVTRALVKLDLIRGEIIDQELDATQRTRAIKAVERLLDIAKKSSFSDQRDTSLLPCYNKAHWAPIQQTIDGRPRRASAAIVSLLEVVTLVLDIAPPSSVDAKDELTQAEHALVALARTLRAEQPEAVAATTFYQGTFRF